MNTKYLVNGVKAKNGTLGSDGCTAQFDSDRGILTLNGYKGKGILTGKGEDLTIKLIGNNTITCNETYQAYGISNLSDGTLKITSDSEATLTINVSCNGDSVAIGISSDEGNIYSNDSIIISGKANIIVNATSKKNVASGIRASSPVSIIEKASFNAMIKCYKNSRGSGNVMQSGFKIDKPLTINTTGDINLDVSNKPTITNYSSYIYGIYCTSTMLLQNVGNMTIKYPYYPSDKTNNVVGAWNASWTIPENFAVNEGIIDGSNTKEIRSGSGIVHTLTLESAKNRFGKSTGQYFSGDNIDIWAISDVSGLNFKNWSYLTGSVKNILAENTTYTMPDSDATVTANYSPFVSQPKFIKINSSSGNIDYTLNEGFNESGQRLVKYDESAEDDFSSYHNILSTPYKIDNGTENYQVPAGKYKIAVKYKSKWYYSDIFTVNYGASYRNGWADEGGKRYYYSYSKKYRNGTYKIENKEYYFDKDGVMLSNNWAQDLEDDSKPWYWANSDGTLVTGWQFINGKWYYFDNYYRMITGVKELKGSTYLFYDSGAMVEGTGWKFINGKWYYLLGGGSNTTIVTNCWKQIRNIWYYFGEDGVMYDKPTKIYGKLECFDASGAWIEKPKDGWFSYKNSNGVTDWWYYKKGYAEYDWQKINGKWYYFGPLTDDGKMYDKPTKIYGKIECFDASGAWIENPKNGWFSYKNSEGKTEWYYFENGKAVTGWKKIGNDWYYMDKYTGLMYSDKELYDTNDSRNYYLKSSGEMAVDLWRIDDYGSWKYYNKDGVREDPYGWKKINGNYYYFGTGCLLVKDTIREIDDKYYMFDKDGKMLSNGWYSRLDVQTDYEMGKSGDGYYKEFYQWYYLGEDGAMKTSTWMKDQTGMECYLDQTGKKIQNKKEKIDDKIYCFDENGHKIVNGFFETENDEKYYLGDDGVAYVEKWLKDYNGYDYYFDVWGYMVRNKKQYSIKNEETNEYEYYEFDSEGRCIKK